MFTSRNRWLSVKLAPAKIGINLAGVVRRVSNDDPVTLPRFEVGSRVRRSQPKVELVLVNVPPLAMVILLFQLTVPVLENVAALADKVPPLATAIVLSPAPCGATKLAGLSTDRVPLTLTVAPALICTLAPVVKFNLLDVATVNVPDGKT